MTRPGVRLVLVLLLLAALCGAGYVAWSGEQTLQSAAVPAREFDLRAGRVLATLAEMRIGHQAYVASGQSLQWWQGRVAAGFEDVRTALAQLRLRTSDPAVLEGLDAAAGSLDEFALADRRAANLVRVGETNQASRLVFGDGAAALVSTAERIGSARLVRMRDLDARRAAQRALEMKAAAGCAALALLVAVLLFPAGTKSPAAADETAATTILPLAANLSSLGDAPAPALEAQTAPPSPPSDPAAAPAAALEPARETATRDRRKAPELRAAADLCTDLARLRESQELPGLLDRTARLLDAVGLIVWVADPLGNELRPTFAHGYPPQTLSRLPAIARSADNATAAAFRHTRVEIVRTNGMSPGAIVVPLLTPAGCVGVLAAEVRHGREASETSRAMARILAAQFSTLLAVPAAEDHARHAVV